MSAREAGRGLTAEAFATLLARLGPDAERAGAAYEALRRALIGFFTWRGAATPEECADDTLDRLAARLNAGALVEDVPRFTRGIARLVLLEHWRRPDARWAPIEEATAAGHLMAEAPGDDALQECLNRCLDDLLPDRRELILKYYVAEGRTRLDNRRRLAQALGISETALRNRAQRLRDRLERCVTECLDRPAHRGPDAGDDMKT
jgi:DNA-directed RNA polymerase specialized sigma24 family protein